MFPAIDCPELRQADREILVGPWLTVKNLDVMRAIHRLEKVAIELPRFEPVGEFRTAAAFRGKRAESVGFDDGRILGLPVVGKMPRGPVEVELADVW